jgi:hypothetical protein
MQNPDPDSCDAPLSARDIVFDIERVSLAGQPPSFSGVQVPYLMQPYPCGFKFAGQQASRKRGLLEPAGSLDRYVWILNAESDGGTLSPRST